MNGIKFIDLGTSSYSISYYPPGLMKISNFERITIDGKFHINGNQKEDELDWDIAFPY
jgi:hypothetical protein